MDDQPRKYASEIERRRKPLKDVDSTARARFAKAFVCLGPVGFLLGIFLTISFLDRGDHPLVALARGFGIGLGGLLLVYGSFYFFLIGGAAGLLSKLYGGGTTGTPMPSTYWRAQALSVHGSFAKALEALEAEAARAPDDPGPCLRAAALCIEQMADPDGAIAWYGRARRAPGLSRDADAFICVRLADLYESLDEGPRAMVELRRLLERHPDCQYAPAARSRLADLKARQAEAYEAELDNG